MVEAGGEFYILRFLPVLGKTLATKIGNPFLALEKRKEE